MPSASFELSSTTACEPLTGLTYAIELEPASVFRQVFQVNATSAAVSGVPSWNLMPSLILNVYSRPSGLISWLSAASYSTLPSAPTDARRWAHQFHMKNWPKEFHGLNV